MQNLNNQSIKDRFWSFIEDISFLTDEDCWNWIGSKMGLGYGILGIGSHKKIAATALSYFWFRDNTFNPRQRFKRTQFVCHKCDNKACINPHHLYLATCKENTHDAINKGLFNPITSATLSETEVNKIRETFEYGKTKLVAYARQYKVSDATISRIVRNKIWKHLLK